MCMPAMHGDSALRRGMSTELARPLPPAHVGTCDNTQAPAERTGKP